MDDDFTGFEQNDTIFETNSISLEDVYSFLLDANKETVRQVIRFSQPLSGLCSIKEAAEAKGIKPPTYCQNSKYKKYKFIGKTFGVKD